MAVARIRNEFGDLDEEEFGGAGGLTGIGDLLSGLTSGGVDPSGDLGQLPMPQEPPPEMVIPGPMIPNETPLPLGSVEGPRQRVRTAPTTATGGGRATPTRSRNPMPIAAQPPQPTRVGAGPSGGGPAMGLGGGAPGMGGPGGQAPPAVTTGVGVARQPLVLGGAGRSALGGGDQFSGGFGAGLDQGRPTPKSILATLMQALGR